MRRVLLVLNLFLFLGVALNAQTTFDIQLKLQILDSLNQTIHFDVLLRNKKDEPRGLAGQNYRLFYSTETLSFQSGESLLGEAYQSFTLIQNIQNIDASATNGTLNFDEDLGFINFSIDLINTAEGGVFLSNEDGWVNVATLSFKLTQNLSTDKCLELIWGRAETTEVYAASFVEISEWISQNNTTAAKINEFGDWQSKSCKKEGTKDYYLMPKVFLQGCYVKSTGLMRDDLRKKKLIPLHDPYSSNNYTSVETTFIESESILNKTGEEAIIDWILVELRTISEPNKTAFIKPALLQRNGNIVATDGTNPVHFELSTEAYYIIIRHRNHLGIMTALPIVLSPDIMKPTIIDFTNNSVEVHGSHAQVKQGNLQLLWGGDTSGDGYIVFQGGGVGLPDNDVIFFDILSDDTNLNSRYNHVTYGYYNTDTNMDGQIIYQGGANDIDDLIFFNVFAHPENINFFTNFFIKEQIQSN